MSLTSIRGKDWAFQALWASCPTSSTPSLVDPNNDRQVNPNACLLNIPITCLFKDGMPSKCLMTDDSTGRIKRIYLERIVIDRVQERIQRGHGTGPPMQNQIFRAMLKVLLDYSQQNGYDVRQDDNDNKEEPFIAKVTYSDDQSENLNLKTLEILLRNDAWRLQILMIQGYVSTTSIQTGVYSKKPNVRSKVDSSITETADQFTKSIAKYAEKAYAQNTSQLMGSGESTNGDTKGVTLKVETMQCSFGLDHHDRVIFLHADFTAVAIENNQREVEDYMKKEKNSRVLSASEKVNNELMSLLTHAHRRGLTIEQSFKHFDVANNGFIDTEALIDGLARLGIGVTYPVGENLLQLMGGVGSNFVTQNDFERYLISQIDDYAVDHQKKVQAAAGPKIDPVKKAQQESVKQKKMQQLFPPKKDTALDIALSQQHAWEDELAAQQQVEEELPLALPEQMYTTRPELQPKPGVFPAWAAKRSRRALGQLLGANAKIGANKRTRVNEEGDSVGKLQHSMSATSLGSIDSGPGESSKSLRQTSSSVKKSKKGSSKSPSKKRPNTSLDLESLIQQSMPADPTAGSGAADELLHLDSGVIMTYRVLDGIEIRQSSIRTKQKTDSLRYHSILSVREKNLQGYDQARQTSSIIDDDPTRMPDESIDIPNEDSGQPVVEEKECLTLVIIPDLTMTLDTLQQCFEILLRTHPSLRIILVGLIGLPNTMWPGSWVINSDLQAKCIGNLMNHLHSSKRLFFHPIPLSIDQAAAKIRYVYHDNLVFMGFGVGSFHLSRFLSQQLPILDQSLQRSVRNIILVNGFLKMTKKFRNICKELRNALLRANIFEANELVTSLLLYDDYLAKNNREQCLVKFWSSRRGFRTIPTGDLAADTQLIQQDKNGLGYLGILEQLKGLIVTPDEFDGAMILAETDIPIIVVQATENVFIDPKVASVFSPDQLPPERTLVKDIADVLEPNTVYVSWLKSGHEVIQERAPYLLSLVTNIAKLLGLDNQTFEEVQKDENTEIEGKDEEKDDPFDLMQLANRSNRLKSTKKKSTDDRDEPIDFDFDNSMHDAGANNLNEGEESQDEFHAEDEPDYDDLRMEDVDDENKDEAGQPSAAETETEKRRRRAQEKMKKAQANIERKKRMIKQARQQELEVFYEREREEKERASEKRELKLMIKEDARSKFAEEYRMECQINEMSKQIAKMKAAELKALRRQEAIKKVEEDMARKRSERIEKRRRQAAALVEKIASEELVLQGLREGGYDLPSNSSQGERVYESIEASHRLMKDLMECRQKYIESIKRQNILQEKYDTFQKQLQTIENEERRLRRAIRLIELNPAIVGEEVNAETQLQELRSSLMSKQETLTEMQALVHQRQSQLYASNKSVIVLKLASKDRDVLMATRIKELYAMEVSINNVLKKMKMEKENLIVNKDKLRIKVIQHQKRIDSVAKELLRVRDHKGKMIDTDVWIEGVMQRCLTTQLIDHLKSEQKKAEDLKEEVTKELDVIRKRAFDLSEIIAQKKRDCDKVGNVAKILQRQYLKFSAVSVETMMQNLKALQMKAQQVELKRSKESDLDKALLFSSLSLVDKVRMKESEIRSKDERQFVGMDLILNPNEYLHLSAIEAEQMQFDDDYQCALSKPDLERILKLPEQINLAIPFLHTAEEINAHRLLNKFIRGRDESYYRNKDFLSISPVSSSVAGNGGTEGGDDNSSVAGTMFDDSSIASALRSINGLGGGGGSVTTIKDADEAEMIHDILVKESLRDRLRCMFDDEKLTEEEQHWIIIDQILAPHIYGLDDDGNDATADRDDETIAALDEEEEDDHSSVNTGKGSKASKGGKSKASKNSKTSKASKGSTSVNTNTRASTIGPDGKRPITNLANTVIWPAEVKGKPPREDDTESTKRVDASKEGNMYEPLRRRYDVENEDIFDYYWHCPYSKADLIKLHRTPAVEVKTELDKSIKALLTKYFVTDEESMLGHSKLETLKEITKRIVEVIQQADEDADYALQANRKNYYGELDRVDGSDGVDDNASLGGSTIASVPTTATRPLPRTTVASPDKKIPPQPTQGPDDEEPEITRIWGSWNQVHPASQGKTSQSSYFRLTTFNVSRDHPASFALKPAESDEEESDDDEMELMDSLSGTMATEIQSSPRTVGIKTLTADPGSNSKFNVSNNGLRRKDKKKDESLYYICDSLEDLAQQNARRIRNKIVLLQVKDSMILHEELDNTIQARQSRSHYFQIPDRDNCRVLDMTVSIVFQGTFSTHGYKLGRLAAALFKLPPDPNGSSGNGEGSPVGQKKSKGGLATGLPIPIGYTPYENITPNLPNSMGKIVIFHKPKDRPITPGSFQIVIGSAAVTKYSIEVTAHYAKAALPVVDEEIIKAKYQQSRLPLCLMELDSIAESLRLAERKLLCCEKLIQEAELECERCQKGIRIASTQLAHDDEEMTMLEDERRELQRELDIFETEYAQWAQAFTSRCKEKEDIRHGIQMMYKFRREREEEKAKINEELELYRRDLPSCMLVLRNMTEAVNLAASLNTVVTGVSQEEGSAATGDFGGIRFTTPAEDIRRALKNYGFDSLSLEEQQWCLLDQSLNPNKYEWLREQEEKEKEERQLLGKKAKKKKLSPALEPFQLMKSEIEYIMDTPFSMLNRREVIIRKLLTKYHDDIEFVRKSLSAVAYGFDPHLAERTRAKHPRSYTKEEREWSTIDRVLHPEIWNFYVNRSENWMDRNSKEATVVEKESKKSKSKKGKNETSTTGTNLLTSAESLTSAGDETSITSASSTIVDAVAPSVISIGNDDDFAAVVAKLQQSTSLQLRDKADAQAKAALQSNGLWSCPYTNKEQIMKIWKTPRHYLSNDDERKVFQLLHKFNGSFTAYQDMMTQASRRKDKAVKAGVHIQWDKAGKLVSKDIDYRARQILREIDRARSTRNEFIQSDVLHANDQKFPTKVLLTHLEEAMDNLMMEQIKDRERAERHRVDSSDDDDSDDENEVDENGVGKDGFLRMEEMVFDGIDKENDAELLDKVKKRAKRRLKRKEKLKELSEEKNVMKTKSLLSKRAKRSSEELADVILKSQLGTGCCLACRTKRCRWESAVDYDIITKRKQELDNEIERVRLNRHDNVFESHVALSAQLGGNSIFRREDLLYELSAEGKELDMRIQLDRVDKELHDCYQTRKEYFESHHLHGYSVMLWTNNARQALESRHNRLVAMCTAAEIVDDILDHMLEGWVFGERQSQFQAVGYVPTIKPSGMIRAGQEQITSVVSVIQRMRKRAELKRLGIVSNEEKRGTMIEKAYEIELQSKEKRKQLKVARNGNEHEHLLNETEQTLRFGLFMLTLMYFRAMTFLKREQRSWADEDDELAIPGKAGKKKIMTDERMRMIDEDNKVKARQKKIDQILAKVKIGDARRKEREEAERKEAILRLQAVVRRQRLEQYSILLIQKIYRGHLGRKAAKRWALKRAELAAMNALLHAAAITIQRVYRGYMGRVYTVIKRTEMAHFIALMRVQETQQDEEIFWQTHPWSRFKRRQKEWMEAKMEKYRSNTVMGGSRLTAQEQAIMDGRSIEAIKRELEGLGSESESEPEDDDEEQS